MPGRPKGSRDAQRRFRKRAHDVGPSDDGKSDTFPAESGCHAAEVRALSQIKIEAVMDGPKLNQHLAADFFAVVAVQPFSRVDTSADETIQSESQRCSTTNETTKTQESDTIAVAESEWNDPFHADWPFWKRDAIPGTLDSYC
jgi:hypothetical protein